MDKLKSMINISERDKRLIIVVAAIAIVALSYFFGFQKLNAFGNDLSEENAKLKKTEKELRDKNNNKDKYVADTNKYVAMYNKILKNYDNDNTQPYDIDFFNKTERRTSSWVKSISFNEPVAVYQFGKLTSSNPDAEGIAYRTDMIGYETKLTFAYEAPYDKWKELIAYINSYYSKNTINSITAAYSDANNTVTGTMGISMYSINGSDRKFTEPQFEVPLGGTNIFSNTKQ